MIGKTGLEWSGSMNMAAASAPALPHRRQDRDATSHRNLTIALYPAFLFVVLAQRAVHLAVGSHAVRHSIFHEAWVNASTASTFAFLG
ncbi:MAG: hypothetical protein U1E28_05655 [Beijerinckiaceae bacterium]